MQEVYLDLSALFHLSKRLRKAVLVDGPHSGDREAEGNKTFLFWVPKPFFLQIRKKFSIGAACDFKADPFFLFCDSSQAITASSARFSSSDCTNF